MQVLTDTYGRILTQHDPDGDVRTAVVWVPGDSRIDWDDASDQELVTLLGKYGYNDALTIENSNVTINTNGETETLTWNSDAMDFTADVDMFQNGTQNMYYRTVNDGTRDVTVLVDADGKAIMAPTLGEYTSVLFSVANNGTEIDTITSGGSISTSAIIDACGGFVNVTVLDAGDSVFLLVMGTHVQYCNGDDTTTTPTVSTPPTSTTVQWRPNGSTPTKAWMVQKSSQKLIRLAPGGDHQNWLLYFMDVTTRETTVRTATTDDITNTVSWGDVYIDCTVDNGIYKFTVDGEEITINGNFVNPSVGF